MKYCKVCKRNRENKHFYIRKRNGNPYGDCKECQFTKSKERFRLYKEDAISYLGGSCIICGYNKYIGALEFHHRDSSEKDTKYYAMRNWSFESKKKELDKCVLLCANCHREVEAGLVSI